MTEHNWRLRAACRDHDPEMWFPETTDKTAQQRTAQATAICQQCPVLRECADYANKHLVHGIWGGKRISTRELNSHYTSPLTGVSGLKPHGTAAALRRHYRLKEPACETCLQGARHRHSQLRQCEQANQ